MIKKFYNSLFTVQRPTWTIDEEENQFSQLKSVALLKGQLQQASPQLVQNLGLNFSKTFSLWCALNSNVKEGDTLRMLKGTVLTYQNEIQEITPTYLADSGTYTLTFNGQTTGGIAFNATADEIETELEGLSTIMEGNVSVTGDLQSSIVIEFINTKGETPQSLISIDTSALFEGSVEATATVTETQEGGAVIVFQNEIQNIAFSEIPTKGHFKLSFGGFETHYIESTQITDADIQLALEEIVGVDNVVVTYVDQDTYDITLGFNIEFTGTYANAQQFMIQFVENTLATSAPQA